MVHDSFTKRKHVRGVRRGTYLRPLLAILGLTVPTLLVQAALAQPQANPQPSAKPPPPPPVVAPAQTTPAVPAKPPTLVGPQKPPIVVPQISPPVVRPGVPAPPPAGKTPPVVAVPPPLAKPFPLEADLPRSQGSRMELAGYRGGVFLRDSSDAIRIHARGRLHLDFHSFFDAKTDQLSAESGNVFLSPRLSIRRARIEVAADLWRRWFALFGLDFGSQPIANVSGGLETSAASPGQTPTADTARFAAFQTPSAAATLANAYVDYTFLRQLHLMIGQHQAPFSLENRTGNNTHTWLERNMAIRSFVVPNGKEIGALLWGDINDVQTLSYEFGVFLGDGPNRPQVDGYADFIGRVFARPWARSGKSSPYDKVQVGMSFQGGSRDPKFVAYDYPAITTAFGWALWNPRYKDSQGRTIHVIPSAGQIRVGGELRVPIKNVDVRAEAYWVDNGTREAVDGLQLKYSERYGNVQGLGYYVQVSVWPWGDAFVTPDPGFSRPPRLDLTKTPNIDKRGIELSALFGGVDATYNGASRKGPYDARTPGAPGGLPTTLSVHEVGLGATYWHSQFIRVSVNYLAYHTKGSDVGENLATVPSNIGMETSSSEGSTWHHELGMRLGLAF